MPDEPLLGEMQAGQLDALSPRYLRAMNRDYPPVKR
jgi:hypothetical protein